MARTLNAAFVAEKNKNQNFPVTLYEVQIDNTTTLFLAELDENVVFDGKTYLSFGISRGSINQNSEGRIDQMIITIANVSLELSALIALNDLRNNLITIRTVFFDTLDTPASTIDADFYIRSYLVNQLKVDFLVGSKLEIFDLILPKRTYNRTHCPFNYVTDGTGECKYSLGSASPPDEGSCDKGLGTPNGCRAHDNILNFGGFPDIPQPSRLVFA